MKRRALGMVWLTVGIVLGVAGCNSDSDPAPKSILSPDGSPSTWKMDVTTADGSLAITDSSLVISCTSGVYKVAWMSGSDNGSATFNTNTFTVTMSISHNIGDLETAGTLNNNNFMSGAGTIVTYQGLKVITWAAERR